MPIGERLRGERERLGMAQPAFAAIAGTTKQTLFSWETDKTAPDAVALAAWAAVGLDVLYVVTGERDFVPPPSLTAEEQTMLDYFRDASKEVRRAALGALLGAAPAGGVGGHFIQHSTGAGAVQVGGVGNTVGKRRR